MRQVYEYHPVIGYRFIPHLKARIPHESGGYLLRSNGMGFRSEREFAAAPTPGKARVLVFGDSFTAGDGVANPHRYTDLLETALDPLEVYNFGLSSSGTDQQYLAWREYGQALAHDVLVIAVFVENIRRVLARYRPHRDAAGVEKLYAKPYFRLDGDTLTLCQVPPAPGGVELAALSPEDQGAVDHGGRFALLRGVVNVLGAKHMVQRLTRYQNLPEYDAAHSMGWRLMRAILARWVRESMRPVLLMPLPLPQHLDEVCDARAYQARFAELAAELGCALHDPLPDLLAAGKAERRRFRFEQDIHFTPAGHRALAASLAPALARLLRKEVPCPA